MTKSQSAKAGARQNVNWASRKLTPCVAFAGQRGRTYEIQRAPSVTGPWDTITIRVAPPGNLIEYTDKAALPPVAFYRVHGVP